MLYWVFFTPPPPPPRRFPCRPPPHVWGEEGHKSRESIGKLWPPPPASYSLCSLPPQLRTLLRINTVLPVCTDSFHGIIFINGFFCVIEDGIVPVVKCIYSLVLYLLTVPIQCIGLSSLYTFSSSLHGQTEERGRGSTPFPLSLSPPPPCAQLRFCLLHAYTAHLRGERCS